MSGEHATKAVDKAAPFSDHNETLPSAALASEAKQAANAEHDMTLWQAIKTYPHAIGWSVLVSSTLSKMTVPVPLRATIRALAPGPRLRQFTNCGHVVMGE